MDYIDKIKKLLALAKSPNEEEAKQALLKAHEMMAKYKIDQKDVKVEDKVKEDVISFKTGVFYSKRRDPWIEDLGRVIAQNFCCTHAYRSAGYRTQDRQMIFIGFESDTKICNEAFQYAVMFVQENIKNNIAKPLMKDMGVDYRTRYISQCCNGYGFGFASGLSLKFYSQYKQNKEEWGLVLVQPQEVKDYVRGHVRVVNDGGCAARDNMSAHTYHMGHEDGKRFDVSRRQIG